MNRKSLIWIVSIWVVLTLVNYYLVPYFIVALEWLILSLVLLIWSIGQIVKLIKERKNLSRQRIASVLVISSLFLLTFFRQPVNQIIEKADWYIFFNKRTEVVEQVKNGELEPNVSWNGWVCELPYEFPVISNGGNDIGISKNDSTNEVTVTFWVFRNFFSSPSTHFVYTNRPEDIKHYNELSERHPDDNWKIEENWYRTFHE
ncbi:hypothetical protein [Hwangdonia lutea]|uniref:Uncharacterized protein n=1 Tax=Hwangdonia lutea TaxID=3075823 RepID=A0AA97EM96_9FLAO|nr:hypothetical protein [Hwangdonia sp. SCSIO 19198]WOD43994.1 hypothetical protein RNZ46_01740 [Hwangdonia sp. SCSIO 19198]